MFVASIAGDNLCSASYTFGYVIEMRSYIYKMKSYTGKYDLILTSDVNCLSRVAFHISSFSISLHM